MTARKVKHVAGNTKTSPREYCRRLFEMSAAAPERTYKEIADELGFTKGYASHLRRIAADLAPELLRAWWLARDPLPKNDVYRIASMPRGRQQEAWDGALAERKLLRDAKKKGLLLAFLPSVAEVRAGQRFTRSHLRKHGGVGGSRWTFTKFVGSETYKACVVSCTLCGAQRDVTEAIE